MQSKIMTIETKIKSEDLYFNLKKYAEFHTNLERILFNDLSNALGIDSKLRKTLKSQYISKYQIHARLYNALWNDVIGKINSLKELHNLDIKEIKSKIKAIEKKIKKAEKSLNTKPIKCNVQKVKKDLHRWNRSLNKLNDRLNRPFKLKMMFGTNKLYKQQWTVYNDDHDSWLGVWRNERNNHFSFVGSKDETNGNQLCQYDQVNGQIKITLPYCFKDKHLVIPVDFNSTNQRRQKQYFDYFHEATKSGQALSYKFLKRDNGYWYVQCSFELETEQVKTYNGALGIDFNYGNMVESSVSSTGNFTGFEQHKFDLEDKSSEQIEQITSKIIQKIVGKAVKENRSICIEKLDLTNCKQGYNKEVNRKVSLMQYADFHSKLEMKCVKEKVDLIKVNPAYTSIIGEYKYSKYFGVSTHIASAFVIGRRGLGFKDKLTKPLIHVLHWGEAGKFQKTFWHGHHWSHWSFVSKNLVTSLGKLNSLHGSAMKLNTLKTRFNPGFCVVGSRKFSDEANFPTGYLLKLII